jgi:hypothetical protein
LGEQGNDPQPIGIHLLTIKLNMAEVTYRLQLMKPIDHKVYRIPPCTDILQELQWFNLDGCVTIFKPMFLIAICNDFFEGFSSYPRCPDSSDN